ncbi:MAG: oxygenase MpaB family protein [Microbacteriaceae bacterium]|nr:oxygenase MpaB family protein [Microbacteriaceae bacterium]MDR9444483.1 oxygenase MpaB family protein [Microbacteriaceae bacterium]
MTVTGFQREFRRRFVKLLSGSDNGNPPWLDVVANGDQPGLYLPNDAPWVVHRDFATLVGGIRALLVQALHPGSLTGVAQHSRYKDEPLGRLAGTIRWLTVTTFGSHDAVSGEASRVNGMHDRVKGKYDTNEGLQRSYKAADRDLLMWVHVAFMESFLRTHQFYSSAPIPGGADNYIAQWSKAVEPLGLTDVPMNEAELQELMSGFWPELRRDAKTDSVISFIKNPPLPPGTKPFYNLFFQAAVTSLPANYAELLGMKQVPVSVIQPVTKSVLKGMRIGIGPESPIENAAIERLKRAGEI